MNIRSIANIFIPSAIKPKDRLTNESAKDRDPSRGEDGSGQRQRNLSEEEIQEAIAIIKELPGFKQNSLQVRMTQDDDITIVYLENPDGKIFKRLTVADLDQILTSGKNQKKGNLVNRAV